MPKKKSKDTTRLEVNEDGLLQRVDQFGNVMWVQGEGNDPGPEMVSGKKAFRDARGYMRECTVLDGLGNEVKVPVKVKPGRIHANTNYPYNPLTCKMILNEIAGGKTLLEISKTPGFPSYHTMQAWLKKNPEFKKELAVAKAQRADYFHDRIAEVADDVTEQTARSARVKIEAYKHLAAVGDPDTYGQRIKHTGDPNAPIGFIVDTGIRRQGEEEKTEEADPDVIDV